MTLPKKWAESADVKPGDTVYVDQLKNGALIVLSEKVLKAAGGAKDFTINCDAITEPSLLDRLIVGSYVQGAETVKVVSQTPMNGEQIERVRTITRKLVGFDVVETSINDMLLQCSIDPTKFEIYTLFQRLSTIASTMLNRVMDALMGLNAELAREVMIREDEAKGVYWLITRLLTLAREFPIVADQIGLKELIDPSLRMIAKNLRRVTYCCKNVAAIVHDLYTIRDEIDTEELAKVALLDQMVKAIFQKTVDAFFARDIIIANDALNLRDTMHQEAQTRQHVVNIPHYRAISNMLSMIAENSASIAAITINLKVSESTSLPN